MNTELSESDSMIDLLLADCDLENLFSQSNEEIEPEWEYKLAA